MAQFKESSAERRVGCFEQVYLDVIQMGKENECSMSLLLILVSLNNKFKFTNNIIQATKHSVGLSASHAIDWRRLRLDVDCQVESFNLAIDE